MKAVVDINVLFSFFWKSSFSKDILISYGNDFVSPEFALRELDKYSKLIMEKTNLSRKDFNLELKKLKNYVSFVPTVQYSGCIEEAERLSPDKDDSEFLALCLKLNLPLWSNDKLLKNQNKIIVLNTEDIIDLI